MCRNKLQKTAKTEKEEDEKVKYQKNRWWYVKNHLSKM